MYRKQVKISILFNSYRYTIYGKHTHICTVVISGSLIVDQLEKVFVPENTDPPIIRLVPLKLVVIPNLQKTFFWFFKTSFTQTFHTSQNFWFSDSPVVTRRWTSWSDFSHSEKGQVSLSWFDWDGEAAKSWSLNCPRTTFVYLDLSNTKPAYQMLAAMWIVWINLGIAIVKIVNPLKNMHCKYFKQILDFLTVLQDWHHLH